MAVEVRQTSDQVVVSLAGIDRIFALKGRLEIPKERIVAVEVLERLEIPHLSKTWMLRFPGTYVPGLIRYGSYGLHPNREFWAVYRPAEVLVLRMANWDYRRVVLGVKEPHRLAASLTDDGS